MRRIPVVPLALACLAVGSLAPSCPSRAQNAPAEGTIEILGSGSFGEDVAQQWVAVLRDQPTATGPDGYVPRVTVRPDGGGDLPTEWLRPVEFRWDFGDGTGWLSTGERPSMTHAFPDDGTFTLRVEAWTSDGKVASGEKAIVVRNRNPVDLVVGAVEIDPTRGRFELTAMAADAEGDALTYEWDFGDGERAAGPPADMRRVEHDYPLAGTYPVTLTVSDEDGGERSKTMRIVSVGGGESGGDQVDPIAGESPAVEAVTTTFTARTFGSVTAQLDAEVRPVAGIHLGAIDDGDVCRFLFSAWDDASLTLVLAIFDLPGLPEGGGRYVLRRPRVDVHFEEDARHYEGKKQLILPGGTRSGLGSIIAPLVGGLDDRQRGDLARQVGVTPGERERREPVAMPAVSPFGLGEHQGYVTTGGAVELEFVPRDRAIGKMNLELTNVDEDSPFPAISLVGEFALDLQAMQRDGVMLYDLCGPGEFSVEEVSPEPGEQHRYSLRPWVRVDFSRDVDVTTLDASTFELTYVGAASGEPVAVDAELVRRNRTAILEPTRELFGGVRYTARVKTGEDGVRGRNGVPLDDDGSGWFTWSFTTRVDFEPGPGDENLACHVFQTVRDAPLLLDKPAVARVYADWKPHPEVAASTQVEEFDARVVLLNGDQEVASTLHRFVRPNLWAARGIEQSQAEHTANVFFTPDESTPSSLRLAMRVVKKPGEPYEHGYWSRCATPIWEHRPKLTVDVYVLALNDWEDDDALDPAVPLAAQIMRDAQAFALQVFPLAEVETEFRRIVRRPPADRLLDPDFVSDKPYAGNLLFTFSGESTADVVVGYVPLDENIAGGEALQRLSAEERAYIVLGMDGNPDNYERHVYALVHEIGHALWLDHLPVVDREQRTRLIAVRDRAFASGAPVHEYEGIEGFRIAPDGRSGFNKSSTEGNGEGDWLTPILYPGSIPYRKSFIARHQYLKLQAELAARGGRPRGVRTPAD